MKYSKLKHELEVLELSHKHELALLKMKQEQEKTQLLSTCTHSYENGTSARESRGMQWDYHNVCGICGKSL